VVPVVCDGVVDAAVPASPGAFVEVEGPLEVPAVDVPGPRLVSEPVPLLDEPVLLLAEGEEAPLGLSEPVLSA
jgi:hypothetical protein